SRCRRLATINFRRKYFRRLKEGGARLPVPAARHHQLSTQKIVMGDGEKKVATASRCRRLATVSFRRKYF
ncbi:MAG: hypothetical protein IJ668_06105, partial [Selenomonadaceae bacterium]|nr:hypothetical protein [Selenomonadaceae bacterium]